ncbi:hypothetical protein C5167_000485 [Papaver somniferum]|uniref:Uncharacterized protein n=1 Tax=Papaver somniferum TaxID=3469 RepID=A0A4Y7KW76_PAPSO|nr:hypothetical protein C5167_000485 [Papaver somniferum]
MTTSTISPTKVAGEDFRWREMQCNKLEIPVALGLLLPSFGGLDDLRFSDPYFTGLIYMKAVLIVAIAVTELEKDTGIKDFAKSMRLNFGKIWISCAVYGLLEIAFTAFHIGNLTTSSYQIIQGRISILSCIPYEKFSGPPFTQMDLEGYEP